jgi:hypothetical protein
MTTDRDNPTGPPAKLMTPARGWGIGRRLIPVETVRTGPRQPPTLLSSRGVLRCEGEANGRGRFRAGRSRG